MTELGVLPLAAFPGDPNSLPISILLYIFLVHVIVYGAPTLRIEKPSNQTWEVLVANLQKRAVGKRGRLSTRAFCATTG